MFGQTLDERTLALFQKSLRDLFNALERERSFSVLSIETVRSRVMTPSSLDPYLEQLVSRSLPVVERDHTKT